MDKDIQLLRDKDIQLLRELKKEFLQSVELLKILEEEKRGTR